MTDQVVFTRIPIVGMPGLECNVPVTKDGRTLDADGDPFPMKQRPYECGEESHWLIGAQPLCERHFRETCHLLELDPDEIDAEARALARGEV